MAAFSTHYFWVIIEASFEVTGTALAICCYNWFCFHFIIFFFSFFGCMHMHLFCFMIGPKEPFTSKMENIDKSISQNATNRLNILYKICIFILFPCDITLSVCYLQNGSYHYKFGHIIHFSYIFCITKSTK